MQTYVKKEKRYRLINFICLLAVCKKLIGTGRVLGTRILRYAMEENAGTTIREAEEIAYETEVSIILYIPLQLCC